MNTYDGTNKHWEKEKMKGRKDVLKLYKGIRERADEELYYL